MKSFTWLLGRQNTGYEILSISNNKRFLFDCFLIRYRPGTYIPPHKDPARPGYKHYRLNVIFWPSKVGGIFKSESTIFSLGPINLFRPDISEHSVSMVEKGTRYVFSIGWLTKKKDEK